MKTMWSSFPYRGSLLSIIAAILSMQGAVLAASENSAVVVTITVAQNPGSLVVSPDNSLVYVACGNGIGPLEIDVINIAKQKVTSTFKIDAIPTAISPDGGTLYCVNPNNNTLLLISAATQQVLNTFPTGPSPHTAVVSPDGTLVYVPNYLGDTMTVLSNNASVSSIKVDGFPVSVAFSPDGARAYVASQGSSATNYQYSVTTLDTATGRVISDLVSPQVPYPWNGMAISPDGSKVYFDALVTFPRPGKPSITQAGIGVVDTATNTLANTIDCQRQHNHNVIPGNLALTPDGKSLYITMEEHGPDTPKNTVVVVDTASQSVVGRILVGNGPSDIAIAPNGKQAFVANFYDGTISVIQL
jgi:YVTN family beta-propeller protein